MSRSAVERLLDIQESSAEVKSHLLRGRLDDPLVRDAVAMRLVAIGESVKGLPTEVTVAEPGVPWRKTARMRGWLSHHYFDIDAATLQSTVENDLAGLDDAVARLLRAGPTTTRT